MITTLGCGEVYMGPGPPTQDGIQQQDLLFFIMTEDNSYILTQENT
jgi:hypothetical protein